MERLKAQNKQSIICYDQSDIKAKQGKVKDRQKYQEDIYSMKIKPPKPQKTVQIDTTP
jgi:hypothetical protein